MAILRKLKEKLRKAMQKPARKKISAAGVSRKRPKENQSKRTDIGVRRWL